MAKKEKVKAVREPKAKKVSSYVKGEGRKAPGDFERMAAGRLMTGSRFYNRHEEEEANWAEVKYVTQVARTLGLEARGLRCLARSEKADRALILIPKEMTADEQTVLAMIQAMGGWEALYDNFKAAEVSGKPLPKDEALIFAQDAAERALNPDTEVDYGAPVFDLTDAVYPGEEDPAAEIAPQDAAPEGAPDAAPVEIVLVLDDLGAAEEAEIAEGAAAPEPDDLSDQEGAEFYRTENEDPEFNKMIGPVDDEPITYEAVADAAQEEIADEPAQEDVPDDEPEMEIVAPVRAQPKRVRSKKTAA